MLKCNGEVFPETGYPEFTFSCKKRKTQPRGTMLNYQGESHIYMKKGQGHKNSTRYSRRSEAPLSLWLSVLYGLSWLYPNFSKCAS